MEGILVRLIVRGMRWSTTNGALKTYFREFGEVRYCEVKYDLQTGYPRNLAFLEMKVKDAKEEERLASTKHQLNDVNLYVRCMRKEAKNQEGSAQ